MSMSSPRLRTAYQCGCITKVLFLTHGENRAAVGIEEVVFRDELVREEDTIKPSGVSASGPL